MRRPVFLFLIVLMALRGLVGPVMAAPGGLHHGAPINAEQQMSTAMTLVLVVNPATTSSPDTDTHISHQHAAPPAENAHPAALANTAAVSAAHCASLSGQANAASTTPSFFASLAHHGDCGMAAAGSDANHSNASAACHDCDICHSVVLHSAGSAAPSSPQHAGTPDGGSAPFVSAQAAQAIKPPIF